MNSVRIDKWLWAARFFKTRGLAKKALEGGKVHSHGARLKASKNIEVGLELTIRQGWDEKTVIVEALSEQRRSAPEAQTLYTETQDSIDQRALRAEQRKMHSNATLPPDQRPNKKQRRQIIRFQQDNEH